MRYARLREAPAANISRIRANDIVITNGQRDRSASSLKFEIEISGTEGEMARVTLRIARRPDITPAIDSGTSGVGL